MKILNVKGGTFSTMLLISALRNYKEEYVKKGQKNKETDFHNLTDPKACCKGNNTQVIRERESPSKDIQDTGTDKI